MEGAARDYVLFYRTRRSLNGAGWVLAWRGMGVTFEIVPVVPSAEAREAVEGHL